MGAKRVKGGGERFENNFYPEDGCSSLRKAFIAYLPNLMMPNPTGITYRPWYLICYIPSDFKAKGLHWAYFFLCNIFRAVHLCIILVSDQLDAQFLLWYVYLNPLHVSSNYVLIFRRTIVLIQHPV